jgi:hypothetical protein
MKGRLGHFSERRLALVFGLLLTVDLVAQIVVVEKSQDREANSSLTILEVIKGGTVLGNKVALLGSILEEIKVIVSA